MKSIKKQVSKGALERIDEIEQSLPGLINAVNQGFVEFNSRVAGIAEVLEAVVQKLGPEEVQNILSARRAEKDAERVQKAKEWIEQQVIAGALAPADAVTERSLLVGVETGTDGTPVPPGRVQLTMDRVNPEVRNLLLGKPAGTKIQTPGDTTFEVLEVYNITETSAEAVAHSSEAAGE